MHYPQTANLIEQINQSLKSILKKVVIEGGYDSPNLNRIHPIQGALWALAVRVLDVARQAGVAHPSPFRFVVEYLQDYAK